MTITMRVVNLVDKLRLQNFFIEKDNKVHLKFVEFSPARVEEALDNIFRTKGKKYKPNDFEKEVLRELDF